MKTNLRILMILTALCVVFFCSSAAFAQNKNIPVVGGFAAASVKDAKIIEAANFAVANQAEKNEVEMELTAIGKAELQVVAGINYRICMNVTVFDDDEDSADNDEAEHIPGFAVAVVYRNLKNELSLTSWTIVENCGKKLKRRK